MLSARRKDLIAWLDVVKAACPVPVVPDGQHTIRQAMAEVFPGVPYQQCQFHSLREATTPIYMTNQLAKKELKKKVRGVVVIKRRISVRHKPCRSITRRKWLWRTKRTTATLRWRPLKAAERRRSSRLGPTGSVRGNSTGTRKGGTGPSGAGRKRSSSAGYPPEK